MKCLKSIFCLLLAVNLLTVPVQAVADNSYNSNNITAINSNSNNTVTNNSNSNNTNSNNNITNIINSYYMPYNNTQVTYNGTTSYGMTDNTSENLSSLFDKKLCIGGISILDNFATIKNNYSAYLKPSTNPNLIFFNGGSGIYGDFLLTLELNNLGHINRISYSQFNLINPVLTMNLGNIKIGDGINALFREYGQWDDKIVNYDVEQIIYNNFSYKMYPIKLIVYINNYTKQIYGYEISLR